MDETWARWSSDVVGRLADLQKRVSAMEKWLRPSPKTPRITRLHEGLFDAVGLCLADIRKEVDQRLGAGMRYCGIFEQGRTYVPGDFCTHQGSIWYCRIATSDKPGDGSSSWTLSVKHGRDAPRIKSEEPVCR